jgi:hypothetical protein
VKWYGGICVGDHVEGVGMINVGEEVAWIGAVESWYVRMEEEG